MIFYLIFWACPSLMLGSGYSALRVRCGATLRFALPNGMLRIPHAV
ncbi:MAG: hypothetical protein NZ455_14070 [Bacteroidia bacterium]|nr:hypothetical protein [Bacteroidia bacterium]MDW8348425.1 hypothetical protein [Bacteroidia bacterium]